MTGTVPVAGELSLANLSASLTYHEQLEFLRVTALVVDPAQPRNLVTFVDEQNDLGPIAVCAKDATSPGTKLFTTNIYVEKTKTDVDVYRLDPLPSM